MVVGTVGELAGGSPFGRGHEHLGVGRLDEPRAAVSAPTRPVEDPCRLGPLRARRGGRNLTERRSLGGHLHRERDPLAVGRPGQAPRALRHVGHRGRASFVDPVHEDLRRSLLPRDVGDPVSVRGPARIAIAPRPRRERPVSRSVRAHQPEVRDAAVREHVEPVPEVDDAASVRRNPGIRDVLRVEHVHVPVRLPLLGRDSRGLSRCCDAEGEDCDGDKNQGSDRRNACGHEVRPLAGEGLPVSEAGSHAALEAEYARGPT